MSTLRTAPSAELAVRVIGEFTVYRRGRVLPAIDVGTRKARTVLAMLALHPGVLTVDPISHELWLDSPPRDPAANIATLISRLRSTIGADAILGAQSSIGYRLGHQVRIDLTDAADLVTQAEQHITHNQPAPAFRAAQRATHLLDLGEVLPEHPQARWANRARHQHHDLLARARHALADTALRIGDTHIAQAAAQAAFTTDPFDEASCRLLMRAHHALAQPTRALAAYHQLCATLSTELGIDPATTTRNLYNTILHHRTTDTNRTAS